MTLFRAKLEFTDATPGRWAGGRPPPRRSACASSGSCELDHAADAVLRLHQLEAVVDVVERQRVRHERRDVEPFISHKIGLDEVNRGFDLMEAQDGIRSVIEFN